MSMEAAYEANSLNLCSHNHVCTNIWLDMTYVCNVRVDNIEIENGTMIYAYCVMLRYVMLCYVILYAAVMLCTWCGVV